MSTFTRSISQIFKGAAKAFYTFPMTIASAVAFAIVTMIRIQLDWPQQEAFNFLFNCLHWTFALGAVFSLAATTAAQSRYEAGKAASIANLVSAGVVAATFIMLYLFGETNSMLEAARAARLSGLAMARVGAAMLVSILAFIILASYPKDRSDFASALFMTEKAFFIALIYGFIIFSGTTGVASAVQVLLYRQMSEKVYMYIGTLVGFLMFTIFIGYFPDFRKGNVDEKRETAQKQPRFVEILFGYIMIPIALALTLVLFIWAGKTALTGMRASFVQLSAIAASYSIGGIWLHIMVTGHSSGLAKFYRRIYPFSALLILAFEAWALVIQLGKSGLKTTEYSFILIWILAVAASLLLLVIKAKAHPAIAVLICILAALSVLPLVGYHALPVSAQVERLESLLVGEGMLEDGQLTPADAELDLTVRESITDAVTYLAYSEEGKLPDWFDRKLSEPAVFNEKLGFEQVWTEPETTPGGYSEYMGVSLMLPNEAVDISGYQWVVYMQNLYENTKGIAQVEIDGEKGTYSLTWTIDTPDGMPVLRIELDDRVILEENMDSYFNKITEKYPPGNKPVNAATFEDMSMKLETPEIEVLLVFGNVDVNVDTLSDSIYYGTNLNTLYMNEK